MRAEETEMQRLGKGGEHPASLEARAGVFLHQAQPTRGLAETEIGAIEKQLFRRGRIHRGVGLWPVLAALAVLFVAGTVMALASGWRPRVPFLGGLDETPKAPSPSLAKGPTKGGAAAAVVPVEVQAVPATTLPEPRSQPTPRRLARSGNSGSPAAEVKESVVVEGPLSIEARSLADALARWRRDGKAEAALALLGEHERRFPHGALGVEARVARAEILLALSRREQALAVLDSLTLASLPRARELQTLRGELRAQAGRCQDARADLIRVVSSTGRDDLGLRANRALSACP